MDLNKFTQKSQEALSEAQNQAIRLGHQQMDAEHLLLALAGQENGLVPRLLDKVMEKLQIKPGETSKDFEFSLKTVNCLGCCALGPVMMVDGKYYSSPSPEDLKKIFDACKQEKEAVR